MWRCIIFTIVLGLTPSLGQIVHPRCYGEVNPCRPDYPCGIGAVIPYVNTVGDCDSYYQCVASHEWALITAGCKRGFIGATFDFRNCQCDNIGECFLPGEHCSTGDHLEPPPIDIPAEPCTLFPNICNQGDRVPDTETCTRYFDCTRQDVWEEQDCITDRFFSAFTSNCEVDPEVCSENPCQGSTTTTPLSTLYTVPPNATLTPPTTFNPNATSPSTTTTANPNATTLSTTTTFSPTTTTLPQTTTTLPQTTTTLPATTTTLPQTTTTLPQTTTTLPATTTTLPVTTTTLPATTTTLPATTTTLPPTTTTLPQTTTTLPATTTTLPATTTTAPPTTTTTANPPSTTMNTTAPLDDADRADFEVELSEEASELSVEDTELGSRKDRLERSTGEDRGDSWSKTNTYIVVGVCVGVVGMCLVSGTIVFAKKRRTPGGNKHIRLQEENIEDSNGGLPLGEIAERGVYQGPQV